jgi:hypothetical protein
MKTMRVIRHRPAFAEDPYGNQGVSGYTDTSIQALWVGPTSSRDVTGERLTSLTLARGMFPGGTDVNDDDELTVVATGQRFRVLGVMRMAHPVNPDQEWHVTVDLERAD